mgnify:CR=1 FL=1
MSTKISKAFDDFKSLCASLLPDHKMLTNPYAAEQNTAAALALGFGLVLGAGENTHRTINCMMSLRRNFHLILTRKFYATELNIVGKEDAMKQLFEDQKLIISYVEKNPTISSNSIAKIDFLSDNGIEFVFTCLLYTSPSPRDS